MPGSPRLRGEHISFAVRRFRPVGSPPLTRGTLTDVDMFGIVPRITPAYAGNTAESVVKKALKQDHPRLRGEHLFDRDGSTGAQGSPPLTRGTLENYETNDEWNRITPAYAGNTASDHEKKHDFEDHPRLRGEHLQSINE